MTAAIHLKTGEMLYFKNRLVFPGSINAQCIKTIYYYKSNVVIKAQIACTTSTPITTSYTLFFLISHFFCSIHMISFHYTLGNEWVFFIWVGWLGILESPRPSICKYNIVWTWNCKLLPVLILKGPGHDFGRI